MSGKAWHIGRPQIMVRNADRFAGLALTPAVSRNNGEAGDFGNTMARQLCSIDNCSIQHAATYFPQKEVDNEADRQEGGQVESNR